MTDPFHDEPGYLTELPEDLKLKRAAAARRRRWRRRLALGGPGRGRGGGRGAGGRRASEAGRLDRRSRRPSRAGAASPRTTRATPDLSRRTGSPTGAGADPRVPRDPAAGRRRDSFPELFVHRRPTSGPDAVARRPRIRGGDARPGRGRLVQDGELPPKPIVISFDDGYLSQYVERLPGAAAARLAGGAEPEAQGSDLPDADVQKMLDAGWELASHTITHVDLTTLDSTQLEREVAGSRQILRQRFGVPVDNFCYPSGRYDDHGDLGGPQSGLRGRPDRDPGGRGRGPSLHPRSDRDPALGRPSRLRLEAPVPLGSTG